MKFKGLTNIGKRHLAKIHANNGTLEFTKIKFGDGTLRTNEDPLNFLKIKNFKMEQEILGAEATDNITSIETVIDNLNLTYGFHVREFGIFVKDGSSEILYYYMNDDIEASWMPPASDGPHKMEIKINMVMANATSVVVNTEDHDLYLTKSYFLKKLAEKMDNIIRKSGFNLDKTDLTENNSNKLFTAKGALDLFNNLTTKITETVNAAKEYFRTELLKKIDKTAISSSLTSTSTATVASSAAAKALEDKKLNIADAWRNHTFIIGDPSTITDLDNITLTGEYSNQRNINKFANSPVTNQAFTLSVTTIDPNNGNYKTQILSTYNTQQIYKRIRTESGWSDWWRIDGGDKLPLSGGTVSGNLKVTASIETNGITKNTRNDSSNWSVWKSVVKGGFWALEYHNNPLTPGNMRVNIYFNTGDSYNGSTLRSIAFPDVSDKGHTVAYQDWVNEKFSKELTTENLNETAIPGLYYQKSNNNATVARNYPEQQAGMLLTSLCAYGVIQEYTTFFSNRKYVRGQRDGGTWGEWKRIDSLDSAKKITKVWEGRHIPTVQNNTVPFCTLPADWSVCFIAYEWASSLIYNKNIMDIAVITRDAAKLNRVLAADAGTGEASGHTAEALFYINSSNQIISLGNHAAGQDCVALMVSYI